MSCFTRAAVCGSAAIAFVTMAGWSPAAHAQTTTLTMSSWVPPSHLLTKDVLSVWAQNVEKATNGRVKFQMLPKHPSAAPGTFDAVQDGLVDVSYVTASYTPARHVLPLLPELPGGGATCRNQFGGFLAHPLEIFSAGRRVQGRQTARRVHARAGPDVQHQAPDQQGRGSRRHEDPLRRRHLGTDGAGARRIGLRQAGAGILRAAELRRGRRHVLPAGIDHLLQARHR